MSQRNMRFVLEEGNTLTFRDKDGVCIERQEGLVPEGHSLLLYSEDLSYITYGPSGFHYKKYDPHSMGLVDDPIDIPTGFSQSDYENHLAMAAYCLNHRRLFASRYQKRHEKSEFTKMITMNQKGEAGFTTMVPI